MTKEIKNEMKIAIEMIAVLIDKIESLEAENLELNNLMCECVQEAERLFPNYFLEEEK